MIKQIGNYILTKLKTDGIYCKVYEGYDDTTN